MRRFIIILSALLFVACTHPQPTSEEKTSAPLSGEGKPTAPVEISAKLSPTNARLALRFEAAAEQVTVKVSGLDGLTLEPLQAGEGQYKVGEVALFDVEYTGPSGTLVINVSGTFNGARKSRVVTFAVGEVRLIDSGTKVTPDNGAPFKTLPSGN